MSNYKITFQIKTPVSFQDTIMFDGIVAYAYAQDQMKGVRGQAQKLSYSKDELIDFSSMPIIKHEDGYFMASWMFYEMDEMVEYLGSWKKRWANEHDHLSDFGKQKRKVRVDAANFKSYDVPIRLVDISECWFFFQSQNVQEVERLLSKHVVGIGKKIAQGNGLIKSFEIEELQHNPFDELIRPIPTIKRGDNVRFTGYYPPYWMSENQGFCLVY